MGSAKITGLAALLPLALSLYAHHGTSVSYDEKKVVKVTGTVKEFIWRNPHSALFMDGKDESGRMATYSIEMGSPNSLAKQGLRRTSFKPGDEATVEMSPSFTNPASGVCQGCKVWVNGKQIRGEEARGKQNDGEK